MATTNISKKIKGELMSTCKFKKDRKRRNNPKEPNLYNHPWKWWVDKINVPDTPVNKLFYDQHKGINEGGKPGNWALELLTRGAEQDEIDGPTSTPLDLLNIKPNLEFLEQLKQSTDEAVQAIENIKDQ